jgi:hypothetical protein
LKSKLNTFIKQATTNVINGGKKIFLKSECYLAPLEYIVATIIPKVERTTKVQVDLLIWLFSYLPDRIALQ